MGRFFDGSTEHDTCGTGFVARLDGVPKHQVVVDAISALSRLTHRGGDKRYSAVHGHSAGILLPLPRSFFLQCWPGLHAERRCWAVGQLFLPQQERIRADVLTIIRDVLTQCEFEMLDGRDVPAGVEVLEATARASMPHLVQIVVIPKRNSAVVLLDGDTFERLLYLVRRRIEASVQAYLYDQEYDMRSFYVASLSSRSIVYKGIVPGGMLSRLYPDLCASTFTAPFVVFHERFSVRTQLPWRLVQPLRLVAHGGSINSLQANIIQARIRMPGVSSTLFGTTFQELFPVSDIHGTDSCVFDNILEFLVHCGRPVTHALMMMVPEPFGKSFAMADERRAFYEYHSVLMAPWDGPAITIFTDGYSRVGAMLDRCGLRSCRYTVTTEGYVVVASEAGILDMPPETIYERGQLEPHRMLVADIQQHKLLYDAQVKDEVITKRPYRHWLAHNALHLWDITTNNADAVCLQQALPPRMQGQNCATDGALFRAVHRMCCEDATVTEYAAQPPAVLDAQARPLFAYFKQFFAQGTYPALDALQQQHVMSLMSYAGRQKNGLEAGADACRLLRLPHPFLLREDVARLCSSQHTDLCPHVVDCTFAKGSGGQGLEQALHALCIDARHAVAGGASLLILSDAQSGAAHVPIPILLAVSAVHQFLIRHKLRYSCGIIVVTQQAYSGEHMAQLLSFGANGICPYAALDTVEDMTQNGLFATQDAKEAVTRYIQCVKQDLLGIIASLGISTLRSFQAGQYYEAVGISAAVIERYFTGTISRIGGIDLTTIAAEAQILHEARLQSGCIREHVFLRTEDTQLRRPKSAAARLLRRAVYDNDVDAFFRFANLHNARNTSLRAAFDFVPRQAIPLEAVEPVEAILPRFLATGVCTQYISVEAYTAIVQGCAMLGIGSLCNEHVSSPFPTVPGTYAGASPSLIRQMACGQFGVTARYVACSTEVQNAIVQPVASPGNDVIPSYTMSTDIARMRYVSPGVSLAVPPYHCELCSWEDMSQFVYDLDTLSPGICVGMQFAAQHGMGQIAVGAAKAGVRKIMITGHDAQFSVCGTATSAMALPWEMGLAEAQHALSGAGVRQQVRLQVEGHLCTGYDLAIGILLGAEDFALGCMLPVALGCNMCGKCAEQSCPSGIATQDAVLRKNFQGAPAHVARFLRFLAEDLRRCMAALGFASVAEMLGQARVLTAKALHAKAAQLDLAELFKEPASTGCSQSMVHYPSLRDDSPLEKTILERCQDVLSGKTHNCTYNGTVHNTDRAVGSRLSGALIRRVTQHKHRPLADHSIRLRLWGTAGHSLGAFLTNGVTIDVRGDANDYVGKGLCGGIISISPAPETVIPAEIQSVIGDGALYGATCGKLYCNGLAGSRFAVRNCGAMAVVEGVGDNACTYMAAGTVIVLGRCGQNFGAGMHGGVAYVFDIDKEFYKKYNQESVLVEAVHLAHDVQLLRSALAEHVRFTGSCLAQDILRDFDAAVLHFVKVMPVEYSHAIREAYREQEYVHIV